MSISPIKRITKKCLFWYVPHWFPIKFICYKMCLSEFKFTRKCEKKPPLYLYLDHVKKKKKSIRPLFSQELSVFLKYTLLRVRISNWGIIKLHGRKQSFCTLNNRYFILDLVSLSLFSYSASKHYELENFTKVWNK